MEMLDYIRTREMLDYRKENRHCTREMLDCMPEMLDCMPENMDCTGEPLVVAPR